MRIVFASPDSFSIFKTGTAYIFGGAELRASILAKELASFNGTEVVIITKNQGEKEFVSDGVRVIPHPAIKGEGYWKKRRSLKGKIIHRLFGEKEIGIRTFYDRIGPDVMIVLGMGSVAEEVRMYCSESNVPFVFGCASDLELEERYYTGAVEKNVVKGYAGVIKSAWRVLAQSEKQVKVLREKFQRESELILNPIDINKRVTVSSGENAYTSDVLWVGKSNRIKQPEKLIEAAKQLPMFRFVMIMNNSDPEMWKELSKKRSSNIKLIESVPENEIEKYFASTRVFVNTSSVEGFPNTFLQAAKYGKPIVSLEVDPGNMLAEGNCGKVCNGDVQTLIENISSLLRDTAEYERRSLAAVQYVTEKHDLEKIAKQLFAILSNSGIRNRK